MDGEGGPRLPALGRFTFQNFKEPIEITPTDRRIAQANCLRCHGDLMIAIHATPGPRRGELDCMHCHTGAGHGARG